MVIILELAHGDLSSLLSRVGRTHIAMSAEASRSTWTVLLKNTRPCALGGLCYVFRLAEVWGIFFQISEALHHMHRQRIMHRDIKPENIFICNSSDF